MGPRENDFPLSPNNLINNCHVYVPEWVCLFLCVEPPPIPLLSNFCNHLREASFTAFTSFDPSLPTIHYKSAQLHSKQFFF